MVAEGADICTCIAGDPEQDETVLEIEDCKGMDSPDPQVPGDSTSPWGPLVYPPGELLHYFIQALASCIAVKPHQADIPFLVLEKERRKPDCPPEHDKKDPGNLWVEGPAVTYMDPQHFADPCSHLVT
jgi:hypothetical protein